MNSPPKYATEIARIKISAYCDKAERCHWDVRNKLLDWAIPYKDRENLIAGLIENNFLNEERYAKAYVHDKSLLNRWGTKKIESMLRLKGVSEYNIKSALKEINHEVEEVAIKALIKKKELQTKGLQLYQKKMKIARFIISKGYSGDQVWKEIESYFKR